MAQQQMQEATASRPNRRAAGLQARALSIQAYEADDPAMMEQAISLASQPGSRVTPEKFMADSSKRAAKRNSLRVLKYLLDHGADVNNLCTSNLVTDDTCKPPSRELLDMIAAYGWDVNPKTGPPGTDDDPLLWAVVEDIDLVKWCLDHGARVDVPDPPRVNPDGTTSYFGRPRPTILEAAAESGTVETFELLRSKGAPLDQRALHFAVEKLNFDMIKHLLEVVKLDVNADVRVIGSIYHSCSTAICITAFRRGSTWRFRGLIFYLLDHGADPDLSFGEGKDRWRSAVECAEVSGNTDFLQAVEEWRARKAER